MVQMNFVEHCDKVKAEMGIRGAPAKFLGKSVQIDAMLWDGMNYFYIESWAGKDKVERHVIRGETHDEFRLIIRTLEGPFLVAPGDYIVKGTFGEFYSVAPDIFESKYFQFDGTSETLMQTFSDTQLVYVMGAILGDTMSAQSFREEIKKRGLTIDV